MKNLNLTFYAFAGIYALTIGSIIYAYFQANTQSFHDKVAKTIVVKQ